MPRENSPYMQVLVSTYGSEGIRRLAQSAYPAVEGVEYLVSWQLPDSACDVPLELAERTDMKIYKTSSRGLSRNRNEALDHATAPVCVIADDDLRYDAEALRGLMQYHRDYPETDIVCFHITVEGRPTLSWSPQGFDLRRMPRGYYFTSCEISFKREAVAASGVRFSELMGVGAPMLPMGEEELFMRSLLRKGLRGVCLPLTVCDHPGTTTGDRILRDPGYLMVRGALLRFRHPRIWRLTLPYDAIFSARYTGHGFFDSWRLLRRGALYSRQVSLF